MSKILPIRLSDDEFKMLDVMLASEFCEAENRSEWIRLLIHREWNKRKNLGPPSSVDYQTAFRNGAPRRFNVSSSTVIHFGNDHMMNGACVPDARWLSVKTSSHSPSLSPSPTRAAGGVSKRTKTRLVVRRARVHMKSGKK